MTPIKKDEELAPEVRHIVREKGTEPAFSGTLLHNKETGMYTCTVCGADLFSSSDKYDSGTGWPSFTCPATNDAVATAPDNSHWVRRTEVLCPRCGAHLGHVFNDGPGPNGKRYCINSLALDFKPSTSEDEKSAPE